MTTQSQDRMYKTCCIPHASMSRGDAGQLDVER